MAAEREAPNAEAATGVPTMPEAMKCPKCRTEPLLEHRLERLGVVLGVCRECDGVWFDAGGLVALVRMGARSPGVCLKTACSHGICPKCGMPLSTFRLPDTPICIDLCDRCPGLWLDACAFGSISAARQKQIDALPPYDRILIPRVWETDDMSGWWGETYATLQDLTHLILSRSWRP